MKYLALLLVWLFVGVAVRYSLNIWLESSHPELVSEHRHITSNELEGEILYAFAEGNQTKYLLLRTARSFTYWALWPVHVAYFPNYLNDLKEIQRLKLENEYLKKQQTP